MFNLQPLQQAMRDLAAKRREEFKTSKDIRLEWSANLLDRFSHEIEVMSTLGNLDQLEQIIATDADGHFFSKAHAIISEIGFDRQYAHGGFLVTDLLEGEPTRPASEKAEAKFAEILREKL